MAWPFKKVETAESIEEIYVPSITSNVKDGIKKIMEQFKGEVDQQLEKFPQSLGEKHLFDFAVTDGIANRYGIVNAIIDKYVDFIVGSGFYITSEEENAKKIIEEFMKDVNFDTLVRKWLKEALKKGCGFMEIGGSKGTTPHGLKVLNSNYMYVLRDNKGVVEGYNQYKGAFDKFAKQKVIPFKPWEIAQLNLNTSGDNAYGYGIIYPALTIINNLLGGERDMHMLMYRKANVPYHAKLGGVFGGKIMKPKKTDVEAFRQELENLNNKHEWATDGFVDIKTIDFGNLGDKFEFALNHDVDMLYSSFQVPAVLMGRANIPEGLADVQMDAFERRIQSLRAESEKVIEKDIFKRILEAAGIPDVHVEFEWGELSSKETYEKLKALTDFMKLSGISRTFINLAEKEALRLFKLPEEEYDELREEEEKKKIEDEKMFAQQQAQAQAQAQQVKSITKPVAKPKVKPTPKQEKKINEAFYDNLDDLQEWIGFKYRRYLTQILTAIKNNKFEFLLAKNKVEVKAGKLTQTQVVKLKEVLDNGFKKRKTIQQMAGDIKDKVGIKDLYKIKNDKMQLGAAGLPILSRSKEARYIGIARTEVTRVANEGAVTYYKEQGAEKVRWVASFGPRTCPICEELDGNTYNINDIPPLPAHTLCRCTIVPTKEIN